MRVLQGVVIPSNTYDRVQEIFQDCVRDLTKAANLQSYIPFQTKPGSYVQKKRGQPSDQADTSTSDSDPNRFKKRRFDSSKGWFIASGPVRFPVTDRIYNKFAQVGSVCRDGSNCPFKHKIFPLHFIETDIKKNIDYVSNNKDVNFAPHIKVEELLAKPTSSSSDSQKKPTKADNDTAAPENVPTGKENK